MFDKPTLLENRKHFLSDLSRILINGSILKKWTHKVTIYYNKVDTKRRYLHVNKQQRYSL